MDQTNVGLSAAEDETPWGRFYWHGLTLITAWISNHRPSKVRDEINYPFLNFNSETVEVWEWISTFISHIIMDVITKSMLQLKLNHVSKRVPVVAFTEKFNPCLAKLPLKFNGGLAKLGLNSFLKVSTGGFLLALDIWKCLFVLTKCGFLKSSSHSLAVEKMKQWVSPEPMLIYCQLGSSGLNINQIWINDNFHSRKYKFHLNQCWFIVNWDPRVWI